MIVMRIAMMAKLVAVRTRCSRQLVVFSTIISDEFVTF